MYYYNYRKNWIAFSDSNSLINFARKVVRKHSHIWLVTVNHTGYTIIIVVSEPISQYSIVNFHTFVEAVATLEPWPSIAIQDISCWCTLHMLSVVLTPLSNKSTICRVPFWLPGYTIILLSTHTSQRPKIFHLRLITDNL